MHSFAYWSLPWELENRRHRGKKPFCTPSKEENACTSAVFCLRSLPKQVFQPLEMTSYAHPLHKFSSLFSATTPTKTNEPRNKKKWPPYANICVPRSKVARNGGATMTSLTSRHWKKFRSKSAHIMPSKGTSYANALRKQNLTQMAYAGISIDGSAPQDIR